MDSIPFDISADYIFHIETNSWIIIEKSKLKNDFRSVGDFRKDLNRLKEMRQQNIVKPVSQDQVNEHHIYIKKEFIAEDLIDIPEIKTLKIASSNQFLFLFQYQKPKPKSAAPLSPSSKPSNPLLDQTVTVLKPASWIDCISRESKRVFVHDKWIVARILLTPVAKDSVGLKRLSMGDI